MTKTEILRALLLEAEDVIPERFADLRQRIADALHGAADEPRADVRQMNRDLCAKEGHVLGVLARPCLRCHEWFDPLYGKDRPPEPPAESTVLCEGCGKKPALWCSDCGLSLGDPG